MPACRAILGGLIVALPLFSTPVAAGDWFGWRADGSSNWSGVYAGLGVGAIDGDTGFQFLNGNSVPFDFGTSFVGSVHVGAQHQFGNFLLGVEGSMIVGDINGNTTCPNVNFTCHAEVDAMWTVGPRLGFAFGNVLLYGTAGYALGSVKTHVRNINTGVNFARSGEQHDGWFAGGGVEFALTNAVILGIDYKHIDLETETHLTGQGINTQRDISPEFDVVQARLTFKIGRDEPRAVPLK